MELNSTKKEDRSEDPTRNMPLFGNDRRKEVVRDPEGDIQCPNCYEHVSGMPDGEANCFECHQPLFVKS